MNHTAIIITLLGLSSLLSGCSSFPEAGQGGMAEHDTSPEKSAQDLLTIAPYKTENSQMDITIAQQLNVNLELVQRHLDSLVLEGAELCFPATVVQAKRREKRIQRELKGGLIYDAANDLIVQKGLIIRLENQLDYVKSHNICELPSAQASSNKALEQTRPGQTARQIHDLLNSDNQFALNSAEINPKYVIRLAQSAELLKKVPNFHLKITGHADSVGSEEHNLQLSLNRANQVARYLQILGIQPARIEVDAIGEQNPLFNGSAPQIRLVNRRVSIDVIEAKTIVSARQEP